MLWLGMSIGVLVGIAMELSHFHLHRACITVRGGLCGDPVSGASHILTAASLTHHRALVVANMTDNPGAPNESAAQDNGNRTRRVQQPTRAMGRRPRGGPPLGEYPRPTNAQTHQYNLPTPISTPKAIEGLELDFETALQLAYALSRKQYDLENRRQIQLARGVYSARGARAGFGRNVSGRHASVSLPEPRRQQLPPPGIGRDLATYLQTRNGGVSMPTGDCGCEDCARLDAYVQVWTSPRLKEVKG